ncbi:MAG TPA: c-type cytochrome domain-containing protein [Polyangia bacterium]|nr:c-type cytochrome domain-containing protein [Polyangia bacterium]
MTMALALGAAALAAPRGRAALSPAAPPPPPAAPSFAGDVAPILDRWCVSCHGADEAQAGLRLDSYEAVMKGGDDGPVIVAGDPAASQLVAQIERRARPPMPPKKRLPRDPITVIRHWIATGAQP